jgi:hypothetical protein
MPANCASLPSMISTLACGSRQPKLPPSCPETPQIFAWAWPPAQAGRPRLAGAPVIPDKGGRSSADPPASKYAPRTTRSNRRSPRCCHLTSWGCAPARQGAHIEAHANGTISFQVGVPGPSTLDVLERRRSAYVFPALRLSPQSSRRGVHREHGHPTSADPSSVRPRA